MKILDKFGNELFRTEKKESGYNADVTIVIEKGDRELKLTTHKHMNRTCNYLSYENDNIELVINHLITNVC